MIFQLGKVLLVQLKQLLRILYYPGILRLVLIVGAITYLIAGTYILAAAGTNIYLIASLYLLLSLLIHSDNHA
ncbi:MAG: hypothetical protein LBP72_01695 [Dysgonamonadaceae bacterium]|jgi:hypothetical protein|nr:hypothetical protein [Dysgonamonadaceae bacterium]